MMKTCLKWNFLHVPDTADSVFTCFIVIGKTEYIKFCRLSAHSRLLIENLIFSCRERMVETGVNLDLEAFY